MVNGQVGCVCTAILADEVIPSKDLLAGQFRSWPWTVDHALQTDNGRLGQDSIHRSDLTPSIQDQCGLVHHNHANRTVHIAHIDWLKISVEDKYGFHG